MSSFNQFMGYKINTLDLSALLGECSTYIVERNAKQPLIFSCANPHSLAVAESNIRFKYALKNAAILVTDGVGMSLIGRLLCKNVGPRITGSDFFYGLMGLENKSNKKSKTKVMFFGSSENVLSLIKLKVESEYQNLEFCGFLSPPYGDWSEEQNKEFIKIINNAKPDILWVGMTAPKQEIWSEKNRYELDVAVIGNIGAVFDFCAGTYERAPEWARKMGFEWLVRLCKEPRRMWKRNVHSPIIFSIAAIRASLFGKHAS